MMNGRSRHILLCLSLGFTIASIATDKASKKRAFSETVESETRYHCPHPRCNKSYSTKKSLKRHEVIHSEKPIHVCPTCSKVFCSSTVLKLHMYIHTGEKPYKCPFPRCKSAFIQASDLSRHCRIIHTKDAKISDIIVPAGSPTAASVPIATLPAAGCGLPVGPDLPQNPEDMDKLDSLLEKFLWKS